MQDKFDSVLLADRLTESIFADIIHPEIHAPFIEWRDFFFLSTVNERGEPTVSYKGGDVGVVHVVDEKASDEGGLITIDEYVARLEAGQS